MRRRVHQHEEDHRSHGKTQNQDHPGLQDIRSIEIEVEADDEDDALEGVCSGAIDTPDFDDPRWQTGWDFQNEEVEAV